MMFSIRSGKKKNDAVHSGLDSVDTAMILLKMTYILSAWFMGVYGDWNFKVPDYVMPKNIPDYE